MVQLNPSNILLNPNKYRNSHYISIANFIQKQSEKQQWHKQISSQLFMYLHRDDIYRIIDDVVKQRRLFTNGRIDIFAILPSIEYMVNHLKNSFKYFNTFNVVILCFS